jgi:two-component system, cell cycle sensor histidine kinase PleC
MNSYATFDGTMPRGHIDHVGAVAVPVTPVDPNETCAVIFQRFERDLDLFALPVVAEGRPVGLVNRHDMMMTWAGNFGRALYERKPIERIMDRNPLVVESDVGIDSLQALIATEKPSALLRGFILTHLGEYAGIGTALSLLRLTVARTHYRNGMLEQARQAAEHNDRSKSQFLANMSHELRTPLNAIIGFAELMQGQALGAIQPRKYAEYIGDIHGSGVLLLSIINDILDMAKIEAGKMELVCEPVDVAELVAAALRVVAARAAGAQLSLVADVAAGLPRLIADDRALRQILLNLLSNAIKFTPPGGSVDVRVQLAGDGGITLVVRDNGIGMTPEHVGIALQPFGQVANPLTRAHAGTGLGLPLVHKLAEMHDATLSIDSRLGAGTLVTVAFPAARNEAAGAAPPRSALATR